MRFVIAPDSFKGSLTAAEVAESIERGIKRVFNDVIIDKIPMADGGEGTVQSLVDSTGGRIISLKVSDPLMKEVDSFYGILGDGETAIIEMAAASGLPLISEKERNPIITTTYGTGELIKDSLNKGCKNIIIGLGGSATNDGGVGMLQSLGVKFLDYNGEDIGQGGGSLKKLDRIDVSNIDPRLNECSIIAACDVTNPLCGERGASYVFGPQKGADNEMVKELDEALNNYAEIIKKCLKKDIKNEPGSGAAGGMGAGLMAFLNAKLEKGIDIVTRLTALDRKIKGADFVFTGEGMMDYQTVFGKTPYGVAMVAKKYNIPVIGIAGGIGKGSEVLFESGFKSIFSIVDSPMSLEEAMINGEILIERTTERILRVIKLYI